MEFEARTTADCEQDADGEVPIKSLKLAIELARYEICRNRLQVPRRFRTADLEQQIAERSSFFDLLQCLLRIDPSERCVPAAALRHTFVAHPARERFRGIFTCWELGVHTAVGDDLQS